MKRAGDIVSLFQREAMEIGKEKMAGRCGRRASRRREVFLGVIDQISQELENRFGETNMELHSCMSV